MRNGARKDVFWLLLEEKRIDKPLAEGPPSGFLGSRLWGARTPLPHGFYTVFNFVSGRVPSELLKMGHN